MPRMSRECDDDDDDDEDEDDMDDEEPSDRLVVLPPEEGTAAFLPPSRVENGECFVEGREANDDEAIIACPARKMSVPRFLLAGVVIAIIVIRGGPFYGYI